MGSLVCRTVDIGLEERLPVLALCKWRMSALGQKRSFSLDQRNVQFAPKADISNAGGKACRQSPTTPMHRRSLHGRLDPGKSRLEGAGRY
jgi:hypothetical protein